LTLIFSDVEDGFVSPCGVCRQMIAEFGFGIDVYLVNPKNESKKYTMQQLLPDAFTINDLTKHQTDHDVTE
jgi:cytidine deaminase